MTYTLPLPPTGTNHAYHTRGGQWFKDKLLKTWEEECLWRLKGTVEDAGTNVLVRIIFYFGDKRRRDIDGRIKPVLDLFERAGAYQDDNLVTDLIVAKYYDKENPRLEVTIR